VILTTTLWLPILLSAVFVFVASAIVWMALPHHRNEWKGLANEEAARAALKGVAAGQYVLPWCPPERMKDPEYLKKREEGPTAWLTVVRPGVRGMGGQFVLSFIYYIFVSGVAAYVAGLPPGLPRGRNRQLGGVRLEWHLGCHLVWEAVGQRRETPRRCLVLCVGDGRHLRMAVAGDVKRRT